MRGPVGALATTDGRGAGCWFDPDERSQIAPITAPMPSSHFVPDKPLKALGEPDCWYGVPAAGRALDGGGSAVWGGRIVRILRGGAGG